MTRKLSVILVILLAILAGSAGLLYRYALPGLASARPEPPELEIALATWLLRNSVSGDEAGLTNPLRAESDIATGGSLFQQKCSTCHGFDGAGHTVIGSNVYPRVPPLRELMPALTDGQAFTYIHDGIRNTAMPAWNLPDNQIWRIVVFLRHMPPTADPAGEQTISVPGAHFVGSAACQLCHQ
jgi:mono/diheme cytochrome c family protein